MKTEIRGNLVAMIWSKMSYLDRKWDYEELNRLGQLLNFYRAQQTLVNLY